jgi:ribonuclease D
MNSSGLSDPILITRPFTLNKMVEALQGEPVVAVDTESNSLHAYREQVCLIQFSIPGADFLVDPLALDDLTPLGPIFATPEIEKVFHAAEYDLLCLKRDFSFEFNNLFDTMLAARILGRNAVGLGALLENEFGVHLEKRYQRANWGQRPLPPDLLAYARLDTHYLISLRHRLRAELGENGLWQLAQEDFCRQTHVSLNGREPEEDSVNCWRINGAYDLDPQQAAVLYELCTYRDKVAQMLDRPLFKVINDRTLFEIARETPHTLQELGQLVGMTRGQVKRHGKSLLAATQRGLQADPIYPPRSPRPNDQFVERLEVLRRWRKQTAQDMGVKSDVVMPRDLLFAIAEDNPKNLQELSSVLKDVPWRLEHFGGQILQALTRFN